MIKNFEVRYVRFIKSKGHYRILWLRILVKIYYDNDCLLLKVMSYIKVELKSVWNFISSSEIGDKSSKCIVSVTFDGIFYGKADITIDISLDFKGDILWVWILPQSRNIIQL